jgi:phosphate transport system permease protein
MEQALAREVDRPAAGAAASALAGHNRRRFTELAIRTVLFMCAAVSVFTTVAIVLVLLVEALAFFAQVSPFEFFSVRFWDAADPLKWTPQFLSKSFNVLPLLTGTLLVTGIAMLISLPIGLTSAIYLSEYAPPKVRATLKPMLEILAGIPTVVYGFFALTFVTPGIKVLINEFINKLFGLDLDVGTFNVLSAGLVMGIMIIPLVSSLSEDALHAVPNALREASYGLGATRLETSARIIVPAALSGIAASFILAISRAIGETMIVAIAAGTMPVMAWNPLEQASTLTAEIVRVSLGDTPQGSLEFLTIFALGITLFAITFVLNLVSQRIVRRYREVYQ